MARFVTGVTSRRESMLHEFDIQGVCAALERSYGNSTHGEKSDSLDQLIYIILEEMLRPGGLGRLKARQIVSILGRLRADFGRAMLQIQPP
jgi:endonuclease III